MNSTMPAFLVPPEWFQGNIRLGRPAPFTRIEFQMDSESASLVVIDIAIISSISVAVIGGIAYEKGIRAGREQALQKIEVSLMRKGDGGLAMLKFRNYAIQGKVVDLSKFDPEMIDPKFWAEFDTLINQIQELSRKAFKK